MPAVDEFPADLLSTITDVSGLSWQVRGLCNETDPEAFFPERNDVTTSKAARRICFGCPVRTECLEYALGLVPIAMGVWGGTTETERKQIRKELGMCEPTSEEDAA